MKYLLLSLLLFFGVHCSAQMWTRVGKAGFSGNAGRIGITIDTSGKPYVAFIGAFSNNVTVVKFEDTGWAAVGAPGISAGFDCGSLSIAINPTSQAPYVTYAQGSHSALSTMRFNGSSWVSIGPRGVLIGYGESPKLMVNKNGVPFVCYGDDEYDRYAIVRTYVGGWHDYGTTHFSPGRVHGLSMAPDSNGNPLVACSQLGISPFVPATASVMYYSDSTWKILGDMIESDSIVFSPFIVTDRHGVPYIAYYVYRDNGSTGSFSRVYVKKYDNGHWVHVGAPLLQTKSGLIINMAIDAADNLYLCYSTREVNDSNRLSVIKYDGSNWAMLGSPGFSGVNVSEPSIAVTPDGTPYVIYTDPAEDHNVTVMRFWTGPIAGADSLCVGATAALSDATAGGTWASADTGVAIINPLSGLVTGITQGVTTISYIAWGKLVTKTITIIPFPVVAAITAPTLVCVGDTIQLSCATTGGIWSSNNTAVTIIATGMMTCINAGPDTISYTISNFCTTAVAILPVSVRPAYACDTTTPFSGPFGVYPNPTHGSGFILVIPTTVAEEAHVTIFNCVGQKVSDFTTMTNRQTNVTLDVPPAVYLIYAVTSQGTFTAKMVITR